MLFHFIFRYCLLLREKHYLNKWFWYGISIIVLFALPFLFWQYTHHWYYLDFAKSYEGSGKIYSGIFEALWNLVFSFNILNSPVWITGLILVLFKKYWKQYRNLGVMFVIYLMIYLFYQAQFYFLTPQLIMFIAFGSVAITESMDRKFISPLFNKMLKTAIPLFYILISVPFLAFLAPLLPAEKYIEFTQKTGANMGIKTSNTKETNLPQHFADRFGWEEFASRISDLYDSLPDSTRDNCGIISTSWGDGSALHYYRQKYYYPEPIITVGYQSYLQPNPDLIRSKYIIYGPYLRDLKPLFGKITVLDTFFSSLLCLIQE